jgi:hypothetical protein
MARNETKFMECAIALSEELDFTRVEEALSLKTYLASRADNRSKVASELARTFVRKISNFVQRQAAFASHIYISTAPAGPPPV